VNIETIAIVGAGELGRELACRSILGGYRTVLEDISPAALEQGIAWIARKLDGDFAAGKIAGGVRDAALTNLRTANSAEDASREADLILETASDEMETKIELFTIFDKFAKPAAIFASTTKTFSITDIAAVTFCPERCIGMRFFVEEPRAKRLELVRGRETSEETIKACEEVGVRLGKEVVAVPDVQEFATGCPDCHPAYEEDAGGGIAARTECKIEHD
jgi:3-hydroxybutyryl-CoA dehydrogenase